MPLHTIQEETAKLFDEKYKCIEKDCDGYGNIPHQIGDDEWEAEQCRFHWEYLLPIRDFIFTRERIAYEAGGEEALKDKENI